MVNLNEIAESALRLLGKSFKRQAPCFIQELSEQLPSVYGNFQRLEQVIVNFLTNAADALESKEEHIILRTGIREEGVFVEVLDEGRGIDDEDLHQLLNPFFSTKRDQGGTGLGLSVSQSIALEHDGYIHIENRQHKGAKAILWIPLTH